MRQHSGDFVICLEEKFLFQNCIAPQKGGDSRQTRKKARRILGVLRAFLTPYGVDKRLFEAIYHYGALPKVEIFLQDKLKSHGKADACRGFLT